MSISAPEELESTVAEHPSITFLNLKGDVVITWDQSDADAVKAMIEKKMAEGFSFFIVREAARGRKPKVKSPDQLGDSGTIVVSNEVRGIDVGDEDLAKMFTDGTITITRPKARAPAEDRQHRAKEATALKQQIDELSQAIETNASVQQPPQSTHRRKAKRSGAQDKADIARAQEIEALTQQMAALQQRLNTLVCARPAEPVSSRNRQATRRAKTAEDVLGAEAVAVRPIQAG